MKKPPYIHEAVDADAVAALTRLARREAIQKKIPEIQDKLKTIERIEPGSLAFWEIVLALFKELRESGAISQRDCFRPIAQCIDGIAWKRILISPELNELQEQIDEIEAETPDEAQRLDQIWEEKADKITAATFREYGEEEMAYLIENDYAEFQRRYEQGIKKFQTPKL